MNNKLQFSMGFEPAMRPTLAFESDAKLLRHQGRVVIVFKKIGEKMYSNFSHSRWQIGFTSTLHLKIANSNFILKKQTFVHAFSAYEYLIPIQFVCPEDLVLQLVQLCVLFCTLINFNIYQNHDPGSIDLQFYLKN